MPPWLKLEGVVRRFGSLEALAGIDLDLGADEMLVVLGPTGAGKTTLLRTVAGLETPDAAQPPQSGRVSPDDAPLHRPASKAFNV